MGVDDLWTKVLTNVKKRNKVDITEFPGKRFGVGISIWMHQVCILKEVVYCLISSPRYYPESFLQDMKEKHNKLVQNGLILYCVFDRRNHTIKLVKKTQNADIYKAKQDISSTYQC